MKIPNPALPYLQGKLFTNSLSVLVSDKGTIPNRIDLLCKLATNKNIVHLGCLDHKELIEKKIQSNQWLHSLLTKSAHECIGIDINQEGLDHVKSLGQSAENIRIMDIMNEVSEEIKSKSWDYAILGELLEHIDNPVSFLKTIKNNYHNSIREIIITVPNAFTHSNFRSAKSNMEVINSDHRYWFTPYTIAKVMQESGIEPGEIFYSNRIPLTTGELLSRKLLKLVGKQPSYNFMYASSIVAIGKL